VVSREETILEPEMTQRDLGRRLTQTMRTQGGANTTETAETLIKEDSEAKGIGTEETEAKVNEKEAIVENRVTGETGRKEVTEEGITGEGETTEVDMIEKREVKEGTTGVTESRGKTNNPGRSQSR
jgi:hypothetical protein